ncbi:hypothetical protein SOCE26_104300 [Sorangium cellulosum]|uniref:Uncharacterized protein n=1 Tax=Sorangium cellulosum TaxID=56 RepID=A0A2L0FBK8_SORCE|nr:hypothetical protein [Sorangium cellulosum]AUX48887.1 hypothetical protein SOCE26_104300 [Sorangium cellulosum]
MLRSSRPSPLPAALIAVLPLIAGCAGLPLIAGCAGRPLPARPGPTEVALTPAPASPSPDLNAASDAEMGGVILVWGNTGGAPPRTWHVAEDGAVIREEPGIVVATRRGAWRWEAGEEQVATSACELWNGIQREPGDGTGTRATLVRRGEDGRQEVITPPAEEDLNEIHHTATLIGSVGPYLFVEERTYRDGCGAHGSEGAAFVVWNAELGAAVDLLAEVPGAPALQEAAEVILDESEEDPGAARQEEDSPELVQIAPAYSPSGWLRLTAQLARSACYACSDGAWSSYSRSATVPLTERPKRLSAWASPPTQLQAFLARTPGVTLGGWSRFDQER